MPPQSEGNSIAPPNPLPENISNKCGDAVDSSVLSAAVDTPQKPEKKPTRQWAAWTRQEEESFFSALRQVGKNFEKITCRVQSKNKEQVRHYYYRLVRRMNKLLGPGFCLDAKNSKDTNAAMLRWWSLLEKYSCTASKLHLKPRRFKTFIETLAQQLLKDRNRTRRKRPYTGENGSIPITSESIYNKPPGHDVHLVKLVFIDSQSSQKLGNGKLTSTKRSTSAGKGEGTVVKNTNQRRRAACGAAYKKWEKAAIAGVSLVADAAEHLERTSIDNSGSIEQVASEILSPKSCAKNTASSSDCDLTLEHSATEGPQLNQTVGETNAQQPMKLKLQLFPIDEATRKALEKEDRNPHLELTLSARKRISSILEHLNRKWGDSSIASGEIMLFPYNALSDTIANLPKWTLKDSCASAGDVHAAVGSPPVFRLRYGWFSSLEDQSSVAEIPSDSQTKDQSSPDQPVSNSQIMIMDNEREAKDERESRVKRGDDVAWADSLTNISVGDLLSEANCHNGSTWTGIPLSSDSFDAAIAGFLSRNQAPPPLASIFDAEETCDEFSFHRVSHKDQDTAVSVDHELTSGKADPAKTNELMDFYWPDSLGPLDIDVPAARYQGQDLIFADSCGSLGGLVRSIAGGLDAFQNCSLFAPEKEPLAVDRQP